MARMRASAFGEGLILIVEVARGVVAGRETEDAFGGLGDHRFGRDAHLADNGAERVGDIGVGGDDDVVAEKWRQAGIVQSGRGAEADDRAVERDGEPGDAVIGVDRALDERMRDGGGAVEPVLGEGGFEDDFRGLAGQRDEHALGEGFARGRDGAGRAVAAAGEELRAELCGGGIPVGLAGKTRGRRRRG